MFQVEQLLSPLDKSLSAELAERVEGFLMESVGNYF